MALTATQISNLAKLSYADQIEILHNCVENLGLVTVAEYAEIMCIKRREAYRHVKSNKVKSIIISGVIFVVINDKLNAI